MTVLPLSAQVDYYNHDQQFSPEVIKNNRIKRITAKEYPIDSPNDEQKASTQSVSIYNTSGLVIKKSFYWAHAKVGAISNKYKYDMFGTMIEKTESVNKGLKQKEEFFYDSLRFLVGWKTSFSETPGNSFEKKYYNDANGNPIKEDLILDQGTRHDSIYLHYNQEDKIDYKLKYIDTVKIPDSTHYIYEHGDTIWREEVYQNGIIQYSYAKIKQHNNTVYRLVNYSNGVLEYINYNVFSKYGNIVEKKNFHVLSQFNYKKVFTYNKRGEPLSKTVYEGGVEVAFIIKYEIEYYY